MNLKTKCAALLLALAMLAGMVPGWGTRAAAADTVGGFSDVKTDDYFADAVLWAVEQGITSGTSATAFSPGEDCTVAQIVTFLWHASGWPVLTAESSHPFSDVKNSDYYADAAAWAYEAGMVSGETFGGERPCTRSMAVTYMWKTAGSPSAPAAGFTDVPAGAEYAGAVAWAVEQGVTSGTSASTFSPDDVCTRGQIVTFLYNWKTNSDSDGISVPDPEETSSYDTDGPSIDEAAPKTQVAYGKTAYPDLKDIDYGTYRKLDYQKAEGKNTYFCDFRNEWIAGAYAKKGNPTNIVSDRAGYYGITASTDKNVLTYTIYNELDNVSVKAVRFLTFDNAQSIPLEATPNEEHTCGTGSLANGPYLLGVWFDYTNEDGDVETVSATRTLYVSDGTGYFAIAKDMADDDAMEKWLTENRNDLTADDVFQAWVDKRGGNDLKKATDVTGIHYPFKSGTSRYPDDTDKWRELAHEICPDDDAGDYTKAAALFDWMQSNIAYDANQLARNGGSDHYRWAEAAASSTTKGFTMWDSHLGMCVDFSNAYAIMCRELGIPCHTMEGFLHCWNVIYLHGRWELVDVNKGLRNAYVGTDNKAYAANVEKYWAGQKIGDDYTSVVWYGFCSPAYSEFEIHSYETNKYSSVEQKINECSLSKDLMTSAYFTKWSGTIYGH